MGVGEEGPLKQDDLPQAPPRPDGGCCLCGSADQRETGGGTSADSADPSDPASHSFPQQRIRFEICLCPLLKILWSYRFHQLLWTWLFQAQLFQVLRGWIFQFLRSHRQLGFSSGSRSSGASVSTITSSVVSQLQPSIAAAVAQALAGSRRSSSVSLGSANKEQEYADGPAEYNFEYKVADDEQQNYIARQESRDGDTVTGSYNYVNPAGTLVTVNYEAGPEGFKQETSEQKGVVEMRNVPVGWDGPLAGVDDQAVSSGVSASRSTSTSQSDLIAKILASLQPRITSAVQSAIGQTNTVRVAPRPVVRRPSVVLAPPRVSSFNNRASFDQSGIVNSVISSLSPRISSAVNAALAGSTRRSSISSRGSQRTQTANSGLSGLFGVSGQSSVSLETPEFAVQYNN